MLVLVEQILAVIVVQMQGNVGTCKERSGLRLPELGAAVLGSIFYDLWGPWSMLGQSSIILHLALTAGFVFLVSDTAQFRGLLADWKIVFPSSWLLLSFLAFLLFLRPIFYVRPYDPCAAEHIKEYRQTTGTLRDTRQELLALEPILTDHRKKIQSHYFDLRTRPGDFNPSLIIDIATKIEHAYRRMDTSNRPVIGPGTDNVALDEKKIRTTSSDQAIRQEKIKEYRREWSKYDYVQEKYYQRLESVDEEIPWNESWLEYCLEKESNDGNR